MSKKKRFKKPKPYFKPVRIYANPVEYSIFVVLGGL